MNRSTVVRGSIYLATVVASWAVLSLGSGAETEVLMVGDVAEVEYEAGSTQEVEDEAATEALRQEAREAVEPPRQVNAEIEETVKSDILSVFEDLQALAIGEGATGPADVIPELPPVEEVTETTQDNTGSTTTTAVAPEATLAGAVYLDIDGDGTFNPDVEAERVDVGLSGISLEVRTHEGVETVTTDAQGLWTVNYAGGPAVVVVDGEDPDVPEGYFISTDNTGQLVECEPGASCQVDNVGFGVSLRNVSEVVETMDARHANLADETILFLATTAADDVVRNALGAPLHLPAIREAAETEASVQLFGQIEPDEITEVQNAVRTDPPFVFHDDTGRDPEGSVAAGEVVASNLQANYLVNAALHAQLQDEAAAGVEPVMVEFRQGAIIARPGDQLTAVQIAAIEATAAPTVEEQPSFGLFAVVTVLVGLVGVYLATFRPEFWARPRMVALLGIMIVLAAGAVRATVALEDTFSWYVLPAVAFGFVTAVLFDQRIAILMAMSVGVLTALGTLDTGITVYAILAALAPIPFVSSVSTRGSFRNAVVLSSIVAAVVAATTSWFFHVGPNDATWDFLNVIPVPYEVVGMSMAWAFGVSVIASLLGLAALQFFESAFDVTTTLGLLDLTDRNHKALQMLQEKAFGTFNHSLMVGTLSDAAARAIGANALLARAMAYYHDLGKTEHPTYFIENQFGISNPHDELDPKESAEIIREHVTAGVTLARQYKIPTDVTEGIVSHHGDGVMRFFYEKARQEYGVDVDIDDFRHIGHKPRTAESAILMLADSLEAACRAIFQSEEPTPSAIEKVVDRIMDEKLEDGQLSESPLTLAEISKIRQAFLESLIGHYHQRIAYPNFPGS
ncbi:MAG TPA: HDIG domain-containing protein [Acidimicrobiia bacterium]|nr:HDIG domain-containing protein [Acidimicrobiia bacterium]